MRFECFLCQKDGVCEMIFTYFRWEIVAIISRISSQHFFWRFENSYWLLLKLKLQTEFELDYQVKMTWEYLSSAGSRIQWWTGFRVQRWVSINVQFKKKWNTENSSFDLFIKLTYSFSLNPSWFNITYSINWSRVKTIPEAFYKLRSLRSDHLASKTSPYL